MSTPEQWPMGPPIVDEPIVEADRIDVSLMKLEGQIDAAIAMILTRAPSRMFAMIMGG